MATTKAKKPAAAAPTTSAPKPVRFYLVLLFVAVFGVGLYLILRQYNDSMDVRSRGEDIHSSATISPSQSTSPTATPAS